MTAEPGLADPSRRAFLGTGGLAGAASLGLLGAAPAAAARSSANGPGWNPDPESPRFTLAVMPDTQYLFDRDSIQSAPLAASFQYILDNHARENIVFLAHLGDVTENGLATEFDHVGRVFRALDRRRVGYSVLAGNHDVDSRTDDQRGGTPYLRTFGPHRFASSPTFAGATPDGYNTCHRLRAAGREWLILALDWRPSAGGLAWARDMLAKHPRTPAILTTHELAIAGDGGGEAQLSEFGRRMWTDLVAGNDQIFLTLSGHYWPPGRTVLKNDAGNDVHMHLTNYQNRYYGGAAMIRLYRFDLARDVIDVETVSPWVLGQPAAHRNTLARREIELTGPADRFSMPIDFARRFAGFAPVPPRPPRPPRDVLVPGTLAYWRFDRGGRDGAPVPPAVRIADLSGHGNHLTYVGIGGSSPTALTWSAAHHPDQPGHGSLRFSGGKNPLQGAYLRTVPSAPLNAATFVPGYTVEAFFRLPADWSAERNSWMAILGRRGRSGDAGKGAGDPDEPVATLSLSDGHSLQWAAYPLNQDGVSTNWGHELPLDSWWHVAVVNDGRRSVMYVDGCPVARNPATPATGITTLMQPWLLGGYEYGGAIDQVFSGWIGDVRIVGRPLPVSHFMIARRR